MCEWRPDFETLSKRQDGIDARLSALEKMVTEIRRESQDGYAKIKGSIDSLASEFGTRMNTMDKRLVEEKAKWGDVLRSIVVWTSRALIVLACAAGGINVVRTILK